MEALAAFATEGRLRRRPRLRSAGRGHVERLGGPRLRLRIAGIDILMHDDPENGIITVIGVYRR
jgi:hypothetical protein